jgi:hypothetical protein
MPQTAKSEGIEFAGKVYKDTDELFSDLEWIDSERKKRYKKEFLKTYTDNEILDEAIIRGLL